MNAVTKIDTAVDRFLRRDEVEKLTGYRKTAIYAMIPRGEFPRQIQIGPNRVVWLESDIQRWMEERQAQFSASVQ